MQSTNPHSYTDDELVKGALKRDRHFQEMLYRKYADAMFTVACTYSKDDDEAADILQEGFIKVFRNLSEHNPEKSLGGWIRRIIINTALENYRKNKRHLEVLEEYHHTESKLAESSLENLAESEIIYYVNQLPDKAQMVLKLFTIEGYGHQEIAAALNISVGTSKSQLNRAKQLIREMITSKK